jgi:hypothetical protein
VAQILRERGNPHAHALKWGFGAWLRDHYPTEPKQQLASPTEAGPCPVCHTVHA